MARKPRGKGPFFVPKPNIPEVVKYLAEHGLLTYRHYLLSTAWIARRNRYWDEHPKECEFCQSRYLVQIHHLRYSTIGNEMDADLIGLCRRCHALVHNGLVNPLQRRAKTLA